MKRSFLLILAVLLAACLAFSCQKKDNVILVGATPKPHAELLQLVQPDLKAEGYDLEIKEFTDYVTPNEALESGEIDANYFQHLPYLEDFNKEHGSNLVSAGGIHIEPMALYSAKYDSIDSLPDGAEIGIPNDPTNEGRALLLLQSAGLIELKDKANLSATPIDIAQNPKNFQFKELEAATLPRVYQDLDAAVINGNYAIAAGLSVTKSLLVEGKDSPYVNVIAVKKGNENKPGIKALVKALQSQKVKDYIAKEYPNGEVVPAF